MAEKFMGELDFTRCTLTYLPHLAGIVIDFRETAPNGTVMATRLKLTTPQMLNLKAQMQKAHGIAF